MTDSLPDYFVRCHNRHLVNLNYVTALEKDTCICGHRQFPQSDKDEMSAHGLGLSNVREMVEKYSGTLDISYSEIPNKMRL